MKNKKIDLILLFPILLMWVAMIGYTGIEHVAGKNIPNEQREEKATEFAEFSVAGITELLDVSTPVLAEAPIAGITTVFDENPIDNIDGENIVTEYPVGGIVVLLVDHEDDISDETANEEQDEEIIDEVVEEGPTDAEIIASSKTKKYYAKTNVNIRNGAGTEYDKLGMLRFSEVIEVIDFDKKGWSTVVYSDEQIGYIKSEYISKEKPKYRDYSVPAGNSFKAYMYYTTITAKASAQYKLRLTAYTGKYGIRQVDGRYCIAVGTAYGTEIGRKIDVVMANGTVIPCITADVKANAHTDSTNRRTVADGSIVEFLVDKQALNANARRHGNISYCNENWMGEIAYFRIYE